VGPGYCETFIAQTAGGFYHGVAQLLLGFLETEADFVNQYLDISRESTSAVRQVLER
jgi:hypothetical protein